MNIYLVVSTAESWLQTGYGASIQDGQMPRLLVSFVEFAKNPQQELRGPVLTEPYKPKLKEPKP